ncbi:hypothetical protein Poli38472_008047 [Pythium oligandrum]|uniref:Apple domain-containing protein n=1 Tax=Pythium oligandrum TaxID=41045 RepID=A0A8K1CMN6_PYTOL|nr:hypothetical protein Poli38472_008047 [Pythium oligandrum]|eukprot:TMW65405.1 hypothetical protein Poli38472_008047 [Pythium oligandrum]
MLVLLPVFLSAGMLASVQANSLRSIADVERRLARMEYMAAMTGHTNCYIENGFDYVGNDISNVAGQPVGNCCNLCAGVSGCNAFSWTSQNGGTCWLKSKRGEITVNPNVKSAIVVFSNDNPVCTLKNDVDFAGNDIGNKPASKAEDCCDICHNTAGCRAYTWTNQNGGTCYLKSKNGGESSKAGARSAEAYPVNSNPPPTCTLEQDVDYIDNDIGNKPSANAGGCCDICRNTQGCVAFTWSTQSGGTCYLKRAKGSTVQKAGVVSSLVLANPPPVTTCTLENNVDYIGNDIGNKPSADAGGCCDICRGTQNCVAFSWSNQNGGTCYLKNAKTQTASKSGVISSTIAANPQQPTCTLENGIDYIDNDIGNKPSADAGGCCDICRGTQNCVAFSWSAGTCYLKRAKGSTVQKAGVVSSLVLANPPPVTTCTLENNVDYIGNDIGNKPSADAGGCCDICRGTQNCVAFSWSNQNGGTCYLKNAKTQTASKSGVISSTIAANPPAPTCTLENYVDYVGNDIGSALSKDPAQCCAICKSTSGCKAFSWSNYQDGTCWLKNNKTTTKASAGVKSGTI